MTAVSITAERVSGSALVALSGLALVLVTLPLTAGAIGVSSDAAIWAAIVGIPVVIALATLVLDGSLRHTMVLALVAVLAAVAATARVVSTGVGGFELVFVVVILAGRALGARLGFLVAVLAVGLSSVVWGGFGPWTAMQMMALGWVAAAAGMLPRITLSSDRARAGEVAMLAAYGAIASYAFGLVMNLWFWPVAVGSGTSISFVEGASLAENASRFLLFSLTTSTLTWDTVRAITTVIGLALVGVPALRALRRAYAPMARVGRP